MFLTCLPEKLGALKSVAFLMALSIFVCLGVPIWCYCFSVPDLGVEY